MVDLQCLINGFPVAVCPFFTCNFWMTLIFLWHFEDMSEVIRFLRCV